MNAAFSRTLACILAALALVTITSCSKGSTSPTAPGGGGGGGNHAPTLNVAADSTLLISGGSCTVHAVATDPDGDQLTFAYTAAGGGVSSSGSTSQTAIFTGTRIGNDSVTVTVSDGHGGQTSAVAKVYVVRAGIPSLVGTAYTCSWNATNVTESLYVTGGWCADPAAIHSITLDGYPLPRLIVPGGNYSIQEADPCTVTETHWHVTVQRPLPDGRSYDLALYGGSAR